jgi:hypothetical protein
MKIVVAACAALLLLCVAGPALADCGSDIECKDDRLCHRGECVDPELLQDACEDDYDCEVGTDCVRGECVGEDEISRRDRDLAEEREGDSRRRAAFGVIVAGISTAVAVGSVVALTGRGNSGPQQIGFSSVRLVMTTVGVLPAAHAGPKARQGLDALGASGGRVPELRATGWVLYASSAAFTFVNIGANVLYAQRDDALSLGFSATTFVLSFSTGLASLIAFSVDGFDRLRELEDERHELGFSSSRFARPPLQIAVAPWLDPGETTSGGLAVTGRW